MIVFADSDVVVDMTLASSWVLARLQPDNAGSNLIVFMSSFSLVQLRLFFPRETSRTLSRLSFGIATSPPDTGTYAKDEPSFSSLIA